MRKREYMNQSIRRILASVAALLVAFVAVGQVVSTKPRLVVNIVIGSLSPSELSRYSPNFAITGFSRLGHEGISLKNMNYGAQSGGSTTALATLSTGASPSIHGVVGDTWFDRVTSRRKQLTHDDLIKNIKYDFDSGGDSPKMLIAPTLTESLRESSPKSRTLSVALNAESAITLNGHGGSAFWVDPRTAYWASSTAYMGELPQWLERLNKKGVSPVDWQIKLEPTKYIDSLEYGVTKGIRFTPNPKNPKREQGYELNYNYLAYTPAGNKHILDMAWQAVQEMNLGGDNTVDMINISLDPARNIVSRYGRGSREVEDMYYRLDHDLGHFIEFVRSWVLRRDVIFVVTSDGGSSPGVAREDMTFNSDQFVMILNTFLSAKYGAEDWVLGYENRSIYLNHKLIYQKKLSLEQLQNEVAAFALQFRGVSHSLTASSLTRTYFGGGYGEKIQRGFYPRRSGDVVINLMPRWIEQRDGVRSHGGSIYSYDTHVPLIIMGSGVISRSVTESHTMEDLAPTIAKVLGILPPAASEGTVIEEIFAKD